MIEIIKQKRSKTTKQGVYYAIRQLKEAGLVLVNNQHISLNAVWLKDAVDFFTLAQHYYFQPNIGLGHFSNLVEGEKITYKFANPIQADAFWNHVIFILVQTTKMTKPFIAYDPHAWFYIAHPEHECRLKNFIISMQKQYLITVDYRTPLDKHVKKFVDSKWSQYCMREKPLFQKTNHYINIIEDFLIDAFIDPTVADEIHQFYLEHDSFNEQTQQEFRKIVAHRGKTRLVISKNKKRAGQLAKKLLKDFYVFR